MQNTSFSLNNSNKINNVAIIGEQNHGKTAIFQTILGNKYINKQNIQTSELANTIINGSHTLNIFDTQGQIDKQLEIENIFRIVDGVIMVIDVIEGIGDVTQTFLKMALDENIKPILFFSKFDETLEIYNTHEEDLYQQINQILNDLNETINTYSRNPNMNILNFSDGSVVFGSSLCKWGMDVNLFKTLQQKNNQISPEIILKNLWGDNYYDTQLKIWQNTPQTQNGLNLQRCFIEFLLNPLKQLQLNFQNCQFQIQENKNENQFIQEQLFLKQFNLQECLCNTIIKYLPSPQEAILLHSSYFIECENEMIIQSIQACNPQGPLIGYITKFIQTENQQMIAVCKILSGTLKIEQNVKLIGPNFYTQNYDANLQSYKYQINQMDQYGIQIQNLYLIKEQKLEPIKQSQCGNIVGILGLDIYINSNGIISESLNNISIRPLKKKLDNIIRISLQPKKPIQLLKMIQAIKIQKKIDLQLDYIQEDSGDNILAYSSYQHLNSSLRQLQGRLLNEGIEIINSDPFISTKETVIGKSNEVYLVKTPNKHNKLYGQGEMMNEQLIQAIEQEQINVQCDKKELALKLEQEFDMNFLDAKRIFCFGPDEKGPNMLVNNLNANGYGMEYKLLEIQSSLCNSFQWVTRQGVLIEENLRGLRVNLIDFFACADAIHRGPGQIIPTARRLFYACQLSAETRLMEPYQINELRFETQNTSQIYDIIEKHNGLIAGEKNFLNQKTIIKFYDRVANNESILEQLKYYVFGDFTLKQQFSNWANLNSDPLQQGTQAYDKLISIRKRKGLKLELPRIEQYVDKL